MITLNEIKSPVGKELAEFYSRFSHAVKSDVPLLNIITNYILKQKGKQIRPLFVLLFAGMNGGINDSSYRAATLIELLHTATLVHDDVVDDASVRRSMFTINALWKNKIAVLVGDYLLSKGLLVSLENDDFQLLHIVTDAVKDMSEGELLQLEKARKLDITEEIYFEIIRKKTASLISSCCATGTASVNPNSHLIADAKKMGELIGIAFQLKDDLFDFESSLTGKGKGMDIKDRKMTLPLIYALSKVNFFQKRHLISIVKNHADNYEKVRELIEAIRNCGGFDYAKIKMKEYSDAAIELLTTKFPENIFRDSLKNLINYTIYRNQ